MLASNRPVAGLTLPRWVSECADQKARPMDLAWTIPATDQVGRKAARHQRLAVKSVADRGGCSALADCHDRLSCNISVGAQHQRQATRRAVSPVQLWDSTAGCESALIKSAASRPLQMPLQCVGVHVPPVQPSSHKPREVHNHMQSQQMKEAPFLSH